MPVSFSPKHLMKKQWFMVAGVTTVVFVAGATQFLYSRSAVSPTTSAATSTTAHGVSITTASGTSVTEVKIMQKSPAHALSLVGKDTIASWDFKGAYTGNIELTKRAEIEIARLEGFFSKGEATDYELYVSIANQYSLLGDGANELAYLKKALAIDSTDTGLAWYNAGVLFERLKAYSTARFAFGQAAKAQAIPQYQNALADFIKAHPETSK
jgi:hypothetical protein